MIANHTLGNLSDCEKYLLIPTAAFLMNMVMSIRLNGILSVSNEIKLLNDRFIAVLYNFMIQGVHKFAFERIVRNLVSASGLDVDSIGYKKMVIQSEVFIFLMEEYNPDHVVNLFIFSFFGLDFKENYKNEMKARLHPEYYNCLFATVVWKNLVDDVFSVKSLPFQVQEII